MRIFLYEHLTASGIGREPGDPLHSMYREGLAMRDALAADLSRVPNCSVTFEEAPSEATLAIAPETDGVLFDLAKRYSSNWLGCSPEAIALAGDKLAMAAYWRERGVRAPATTDREPTRCEAFPVIWKPRDGCGSSATYLLKNAFDLASAAASRMSEPAGPMIVQEFVPGRAASLAFLCGPSGNVPLIPAFQQLSTDGRFKYHGGEMSIPAPLAERAIAIGSRAVSGVPGLKGYVGVDLVLGDAEDGSRDYAIEINPRLTTSYVGLRALAEFNLAEAMLAMALNQPLPALAWKAGRIRFASDGSVSPVDPV